VLFCDKNYVVGGDGVKSGKKVVVVLVCLSLPFSSLKVRFCKHIQA